MSGRTFTLADLVPEPLYFRDADGTPYDARTLDMFGAIDYARYERLYRETRQAYAALNKRGDDQDAAKEQAAATLEAVINEMMHVIVPTLPKDRITMIAFGHKSKFLEWWRAQQPEPEADQGEATAGQRVIRGRRSPASSKPTA